MPYNESSLNSPEADITRDAVAAINERLLAQGLPADSFTVKPIIFSGNYDGRGGENPAQYGFSIYCDTDEARKTVTEGCAMLKCDPRVRPVPHEPGGSTIASSARVPEIALVAESPDDLVLALNASFLGDEQRIVAPAGMSRALI